MYVAETLRQAMTINPHLKVFVANGYYDLATPYFATEYAFSHLGLDESLRGNISMGYYEAGHMMYPSAGPGGAETGFGEIYQRDIGLAVLHVTEKEWVFWVQPPILLFLHGIC